MGGGQLLEFDGVDTPQAWSCGEENATVASSDGPEAAEAAPEASGLLLLEAEHPRAGLVTQLVFESYEDSVEFGLELEPEPPRLELATQDSVAFGLELEPEPPRLELPTQPLLENPTDLRVVELGEQGNICAALLREKDEPFGIQPYPCYGAFCEGQVSTQDSDDCASEVWLGEQTADLPDSEDVVYPCFEIVDGVVDSPVVDAEASADAEGCMAHSEARGTVRAWEVVFSRVAVRAEPNFNAPIIGGAAEYELVFEDVDDAGREEEAAVAEDWIKLSGGFGYMLKDGSENSHAPAGARARLLAPLEVAPLWPESVRQEILGIYRRTWLRARAQQNNFPATTVVIDQLRRAGEDAIVSLGCSTEPVALTMVRIEEQFRHTAQAVLATAAAVKDSHSHCQSSVATLPPALQAETPSMVEPLLLCDAPVDACDDDMFVDLEAATHEFQASNPQEFCVTPSPVQDSPLEDDECYPEEFYSPPQPPALPWDHNGPRLSDLPEGLVTLEYVSELLDSMSCRSLPSAADVSSIVDQASAVLAELPSLVELSIVAGGTLHVVGDIHGQYWDLLSIINGYGKPTPWNQYLFNGDFVDRGKFSAEVIIALFALKAAAPLWVHLNRGNHESTRMSTFHGFCAEMSKKYSPEMFFHCTMAFKNLPLATVVNRSVLVVHGGLPSEDGVVLRDIAQVPRFVELDEGADRLMIDLLWSDPTDRDGRHPSPRGAGRLFGADVTKRFLEENMLTCVIRSHELKLGGYEWHHDGRCVTVFSAANYCGICANLGAVCNISPAAQQPEPECAETPDLCAQETAAPIVTLEDIRLDTFEATPHPDETLWF